MHDIAMVINDLGNGGTQRVYVRIANAWAEQGRRVCMITRSSPDTDFHKLDDRITRIVCSGIRASGSRLEGVWRNIARIHRLRKAIRQAKAPVTIAAVAPMAVLSVIASMGVDTRLVVAERNDPARQSYGKKWDLLRRLIYPRASLVTANSQGALKSLRRFIGPEKLGYLPNPLPALSPPSEIEIRQMVILNVGRMYKQKAQDVLIRAFAAIADLYPEWRMAFAGTGPKHEELMALSTKLGIADRIDWLGAVDDMSACYARYSIFALPSHYEGMPNALLEAMRSKLPCIVSNASPGPLEVIEHNKNGLVFPVDDIQALTRCLSTLIENTPLRLELGELAFEKSREFEIDDVLNIWDEVLGIPKANKAA
jgi:glycosyltransferase involved in cell wall biosynthesis